MHPYLKITPPPPRLPPLVTSIYEWTVESPVAQTLKGKLLPTIEPQLAFYYRSPMCSDRRPTCGPYNQIVTGIQTHIVNVHATGPVGAVMVRLKPEAAPHLLA